MILQPVAALLFAMRAGWPLLYAQFNLFIHRICHRRKFLRATNQLSEDKLPLLSINVNATLSPA